ncbi:MEKHLA domain-containing protein [Novosphingobium sp. BL-8H]|uniref:MEKHLA domain-containing protein n=1 Tax=Novosphingobium sp. BL-8H TaxID=3127640 RepID=UPI0037566A50
MHRHDATIEAGPVPALYRAVPSAGRIALVAESFQRLLRKPLVAPGGDPVAALWRAPFAVVAHGAEPDPLFFFGNAIALAAFECDPARFVGMPSRLSAEAPLREERQALLDRVTVHGFIDDYSGLRISATGRRFRIGPATVWNLVDAGGICSGQAATFAP